MTLEEAIEELGKVKNRTDTLCYTEFKRAAELGIEALRRVAEQRKQMPPWTGLPLPGETEK